MRGRYGWDGKMGNIQSQANGEETSIWMIPRSLSVPFLSLDNALELQLLDAISVTFPEFSHLRPLLVVLVTHICSLLSS